MVMLNTDMKVADTPAEGLEEYSSADAYKAWLKIGPPPSSI